MIRAVEQTGPLVERLRLRRAELEQALLTRVYGVEDPTATQDSVYIDGFRAATSAAVDFAFEAVQRPASYPPVPVAFLRQARLAARNEVRLDTVLRRYSAGYAVLTELFAEEIERGAPMAPAELRALYSASYAAFDRVLLSVGDEYARESSRSARPSQERTTEELVKRLLAGQTVDTRQLTYPLDGWHLGLVFETADHPGGCLRELAGEFDMCLLIVEPSSGSYWAWLGGRTRLDSHELLGRLRRGPLCGRAGLGEASQRPSGWRLSHRQASIVVSVAEGTPLAAARFADKGLIAAVQKNQILVDSLRTIYLEPLGGNTHEGQILQRTLGAYFAANCNISSAASALKVHRQTVTSRLRTIEERLGEPVSSAAPEISLALRLAKV